MNQTLRAIFDPWMASFTFQTWAASAGNPAIRECLSEIYEEFLGVIGRIIEQINPDMPKEDTVTYATLIGSQVEGLLFFKQNAAKRMIDPSTIREKIIASWLSIILR